MSCLRRLPLQIAACVAVSVALPLAVAEAAVPNINVWSGKTKTHKLLLQFSQNAPAKTVYVSLGVSCTDASGAKHDTTLQVHGNSDHGKLKIKNAGGPASTGTLTLSSSVVAKRKAVGTVSYKLTAAGGSCTGKDSFSLSYSLRHGG